MSYWSGLAVVALVLPVLALAVSNLGGAAQAGANPVVVIETSMGTITAELYKDKAPKTVENFLAYVKSGFYNGTIFHRVIKGFMIQGGGFTPDMNRKPTRPPIANEATKELSNARGTLAMARTSDPNSATAQFFVNTVDNGRLDYQGPQDMGYAVFGKVIDGIDVVDKIEAVPTETKGAYANVPSTPVVIKAVRLKG